MLSKGDPILIEQVADGGFIVSPKELTGLDKLTDIHVFETNKGLHDFLDKHFGEKTKELRAVK
jgi:hypothetical protein